MFETTDEIKSGQEAKEKKMVPSSLRTCQILNDETSIQHLALPSDSFKSQRLCCVQERTIGIQFHYIVVSRASEEGLKA
jgi:hypothetical protein